MKLPPEVNLLAVAPLPAGARLPAQGQPGGRDPRQQDAEHPEPGGRRRRQRDQPRQPGDAQHGQALHGEEPARRGGRRSSSRSTCPTSARSAPCTPSGSATARASRTTSRCPTCRSTPRARSSTCPAARSWTATSATLQADQELRRPLLPGQRRGVDRARLVRRRAGRSTRSRRRPTRSTPKFEDDGKYSWVKAPRFQGKPDAGRAARPGAGRVRGRPRADEALGRPRARRRSRAIAKVQVDARPCCTRRSAATRPAPIRTAVIAELGAEALEAAGRQHRARATPTIFNPPSFPKGEVRGFGFHEAPRGTLSHWVVIQDGKIKNYQAVVPTTWNAGPRDAKDAEGPLRGVARRQPGRRPEAAARGAAHRPLVRPLPGLRGPHARPGGQGDRPGEGALAEVGVSDPRIGVIGLGQRADGRRRLRPVGRRRRCSPSTSSPRTSTVQDLGTPGLDLTPYVTDLEALILVDTVRSDAAPGTLRLYRRDELLQAPTPGSAEPSRSRGQGSAADCRVRRARPA